jgi:hypothetical protein
MHSKETLHHPQNQYDAIGARWLHICKSPWSQHGLLHHQAGSSSIGVVHYQVLGKVIS